jgi:hypothetical protein
MLRWLTLGLVLIPALARADASVGGAASLDRAAFARGYVRACDAFARRDPCELRADLDGDGRPERVVKVRARRGGAAGLAVLWRSGAVTVLAAGRAARVRTFDRDADGNGEAGERDGERDLTGLTRWKVARADRMAYPGTRRDGIQLDGGDAAEVYYLVDGAWLAVILGF